MTATTRAASARAGARRARDEFDPTPWPAALVCGIAGGGAALLAFPPYGMWMLLPVSLTLLGAGLLVRSVWVALLVSLAWGAAFFIPLTAWANTYAGTAPWVALGVFEALYIVLFALLARTVVLRRGLCLSSAVVVSALWVGVETLRSHVPWGGLPWGASAFALADSPLLNLGPWIGVAGLAFVVALLGQLLLHGALSLLGRRHRGLVGFAGVWPLALAVGAILATMVVPHPPNPAPQDRGTMTVAGIQGSMEKIDPATMTMPDDVFENHLAVTRETIEQTRAEGRQLDLIVWPEDSTGYDPRQDPWMSDQIGSAAADAGAPVLIGTQTAVGETQRLNQSVLFAPDGSTPYVYSKRHPVPFGEYIPYRDVFRTLSDKVDLVPRDMIAGDEVGVMDLETRDQGRHGVGVLICFEIAYDNLVGDVVRDGAEVVVVQSNNALFGDSHEAIQQLAEAKVMAVVSGRSVVHVSTVGHSAIFTPTGRRLDFVDHWEQGAVLADVPLRTGITPAVTAGPWIAVGLSALGLLGFLAAVSGRRRALAPLPRRRERKRS
ncbi:MAG: apolipoprotein N-acyltransferase [Brachybacterium sp.]|uniref:apolipoprotein N-acyltransferase n=1 Tax=Brachybacterium sp. TaxID=1891286 RepID=UPI002649E976|nr:apolipoprotein N-acyltransferase [Brachybacterium sp.]MDN5685151.1 apolipoprotein N-acyltransferase [Brachybacterium sp.]